MSGSEALTKLAVKISSGLRLAGMPDELTNRIHEKPEKASRIAEAGNGKIASVHVYGRESNGCHNDASFCGIKHVI